MSPYNLFDPFNLFAHYYQNNPPSQNRPLSALTRPAFVLRTVSVVMTVTTTVVTPLVTLCISSNMFATPTNATSCAVVNTRRRSIEEDFPHNFSPSLVDKKYVSWLYISKFVKQITTVSFPQHPIWIVALWPRRQCREVPEDRLVTKSSLQKKITSTKKISLLAIWVCWDREDVLTRYQEIRLRRRQLRRFSPLARFPSREPSPRWIPRWLGKTEFCFAFHRAMSFADCARLSGCNTSPRRPATD